MFKYARLLMKYNTLAIKYSALIKQTKTEVFTRAKEITELKEQIKDKNRTIKHQILNDY